MTQIAVFAVLQVTLIWVIASCFSSCLLSNRSAASRYILWLFAMISIGAVLPVAWLRPGISLRLPGELLRVRETLAPKPVTPALDPFASEPSIDSPMMPRLAGELWSYREPEIATQFHALPTTVPQASRSNQVPTIRTQTPWFTLPRILSGIYACGVLFVAFRIMIAATRLRRMAAAATGIDSGQQVLALRSARNLSLSRLPRFLISADASTPLVFGVFRSTILLPSTFSRWSTDCQQSVLLHELSHVARRDAIWDLFSQCIMACWWFHPLVYQSLHSLRREREEATDERVVRSGVVAHRYAGHLLSVLEDIQITRYGWGGIAMSQYGDMELRLKHILRMESGMPKTSWSTCLTACSLFLAISITSVRFAEAQITTPTVPPAGEQHVVAPDAAIPPAAAEGDPASQLPDETNSGKQTHQVEPDAPMVHAASFYDALSLTPLASNLDSENLLSISGTVLAAGGEPAAGAIVVLRQNNAHPLDPPERTLDLFARTTSDEDGKFKFSEVPARLDNLPRTAVWEVVAATPGEFGWQTISGSNHVHSLRIQLHKTSSISGTYVDPEGKPIAGARVSVTSIDELRSDDFRNPYRDVLNLYLSTIRPSTTTDQSGRYVFDGLPRDHLATVLIQHPDWANSYANVRTSESVELGLRFPNMKPSSHNREIMPSGMTHKAEVGFPITGIVRDSEGKPVADCSIRLDTFYDSLKTDQAGQFSHRLQPDAFDHLKKGDDGLSIYLWPPVDTGLVNKRAALTQQQASSHEPLSYVLDAGIEIQGNVLTENSEPLERIHVLAVPSEAIRASSRDRSVRTFTAITRADGSYRIIVPNVGTYQLIAWGERPGFILPRSQYEENRYCSWGPMQTVRVEQGMVAKTDPIIVRRAARVAFRCIDQAGRPVAGAKLQLIHRLPPEGNSWTRDVELAESETTDADGRAIMAATRLIASNVIVQAVLDDGDRHLWAEKPLPASLTSQEHVVTMEPMWRITGKATVDGAPMQGVDVMVWRQPSDHAQMRSHSMGGSPKRVDETGSYEWFVPPSGNYSAEVWSVKGLHRNNPSARSKIKRVGPLEYRADEMQFQMAHGTISGKVIDIDGKPIAGASVSSHPKFTDGNQLLLANPSPNTRHATSDEDGDFQIEGLPDGEYQLSIGLSTNPRTYYSTSADARVGDKELLIKLVPAKTRAVSY